MDWTYDLFVEDVTAHKNNEIIEDEFRQSFIEWMDSSVKKFIDKWNGSHKGYWDDYDGWIGDAYSEHLYDSIFSDYYKDAYNQRPHLPRWYYIHLFGLPMGEDVSRTFCATPVEDAVRESKWVRTHLD